MTLPRVLTIAGSDSGGGAGIQADMMTITALGGFATCAITAVTAQNTEGVCAVHPVPATIVAAQIEAVLSDIGADAIKTGMLGDAGLVVAVAEALRRWAPGAQMVLDPVMIAKGGARLLPHDAVAAVNRVLVPLATVITPNIPEAEALTGLVIRDLHDARAAAQALLTLGASAVLLKGGHLPGQIVTDVLATEVGSFEWSSPRIDTPHTHGTGCTLASAIAVYLARGLPLRGAVEKGRAFVQAAIAAAPGIGRGHGPLGHNAAGRLVYDS